MKTYELKVYIVVDTIDDYTPDEAAGVLENCMSYMARACNDDHGFYIRTFGVEETELLVGDVE